VEVRELSVPGAFEVTPVQHGDDRGLFLEWFREDVFTEVVGHPLRLAQANVSVSSAGTLRGIHFAQVPPGQAKYVTCPRGAVLDYAVDLRVGSPTFGAHVTAVLDDVDRRALYLAEGLGHAFVALSDEATVSYMCSTPFSPGREHGISVFDPELALVWPDDVELVLSDRDRAAPSLAEVRDAGLLPSWDECEAFYRHLRDGDGRAPLPSHAGFGQ